MGAEQEAGAQAGQQAGDQHHRPLRRVQLRRGQRPGHRGEPKRAPSRQKVGGEGKGWEKKGREGPGAAELPPQPRCRRPAPDTPAAPPQPAAGSARRERRTAAGREGEGPARCPWVYSLFFFILNSRPEVTLASSPLQAERAARPQPRQSPPNSAGPPRPLLLSFSLPFPRSTTPPAHTGPRGPARQTALSRHKPGFATTFSTFRISVINKLGSLC